MLVKNRSSCQFNNLKPVVFGLRQIHGQKYLLSQVFPVYVLPFTVLHVQTPLEVSHIPLEVLVQPLSPDPEHLNTEKIR